jgi:polysaccharide transporter, PST family
LSPIYKSASWYLLEKVVRMAGAFLVGAWVARYLGPQQYGAFAYATALIATLGFMASWSIESLVIRDLVQAPERQQQIVSTYFLLRLGGALLVPLSALLFLLWSHPGEHELMAVAVVLSVSTLLSSLDVVDCWLQARQRSGATSLIRLVAFVVGALAKCALVLAQAPLVWFAATSVLECSVIAAAYWNLLQRAGVSLSLRNWDRTELKRLLLDGKIMVLSGLTVVIYSRLDVLAIGTLLSKEALGPYAMAASMCAAWNMVGMSLTQAWAPQISAALARSYESYVLEMRRFLVFSLLLSVGGSLAIGSLSNLIFDLLLGPAYQAGGKILAVLVWSSVPVFIGIATSQIIVNERLYWVSLFRTTLGMVISVALVVPIALHWGVTGIAVLVNVSAWVATLSILMSRFARQSLVRVCKLN